MAKNVASTITAEQRETARKLGADAWRLRYVVSCPYPAGSEQARIWEEARTAARRATERPVVEEQKVPVETLVERLNRHFRGSN